MFMPPDEFPFEIPDGAIEAIGEAIEEDARKLGLYMVGIALNATIGDEDTPSTLAFVAQFQVGEVAFSERIQNPVADTEHDEVRAIEHDFKREEFESWRAKYKKAIEDGKNPWEVE